MSVLPSRPSASRCRPTSGRPTRSLQPTEPCHTPPTPRGANNPACPCNSLKTQRLKNGGVEVGQGCDDFGKGPLGHRVTDRLLQTLDTLALLAHRPPKLFEHNTLLAMLGDR